MLLMGCNRGRTLPGTMVSLDFKAAKVNTCYAGRDIQLGVDFIWR